ncbi:MULTISPECIES: aspartate dehydrogenase domain-containing protein [Arenibacter]|uniref:aspartate dehydrogenase domain-containing protein n=1 Tax=Arenibacter TaxID=178469 RepID=UPI001CC70EAF|nr:MULTISPECIES: aspartate dehydrogenase domain-containing protein [Arenibacter]
MKINTLAIVGCGKLAHIVVEAMNSGLLPQYKLIGCYSRTFEKAERIVDMISSSQSKNTCTACNTMDELLALKPDYIVEAASPDAFREFAIPALTKGSSIVTLSIGALADTDYYEAVKKAASENNTRVHLVSGAIGGFDVMRTISLMEKCTASFATEKSPDSLKNTPVYEESLQTEKKTVMKGNAQEAIALFPSKVNVSVAASLATVGPENMKVSVTSTPGYIGDRHRIEVKSEQIDAVVDVYSKTSQIAGWSVVNTLRNITSPIVF